MSMVSEQQPIPLRFAALYCFQVCGLFICEKLCAYLMSAYVAGFDSHYPYTLLPIVVVREEKLCIIYVHFTTIVIVILMCATYLIYCKSMLNY